MSTTPQVRLAALPTPLRVALTLFLVIVGSGYLSAIGNLYHQHRMADGRPELSLDDLRVVFAGAAIERSMSGASDVDGSKSQSDGSLTDGEPQSGGDVPITTSAMWRMVAPGGSMRKHLTKGGDDHVRVLTDWLERGAPRDEFDTADKPMAGDPAPRRVIEDDCLDCHNAESGEKEDSPFGADLFDADLEMTLVYALPGTESTLSGDALSHAAPAAVGGVAESSPGNAAGSDHSATRQMGPMPYSRLALVTHIHALSIPVFTLICSALFCLGVGWRGWRGWIGVLPMVALTADFSSWWLARYFEPAIYVIAAAGGVFGVSLAVQLLSVLAAIWRRNGGQNA